MKLSLLTSHASICNTCVMHHHTGPAPGIMPARSPDLTPIENMWSMVGQQLSQITPPAATLDQLWQRVEAAWSAVPQEHIQSLFESMPRRVAAMISNNSGYSWLGCVCIFLHYLQDSRLIEAICGHISYSALICFDI
ncbi:transposable element Tcb1 transposase [Trichonephila clavipes]|nr:transposable element Tcb1 transposase [Trichonephila clavipes]